MTDTSFFQSTKPQSTSLDRENLLSAVVLNTPECVKLIDENGTLLDMNAAGLELIEADNWECVKGANVYDLLADEHVEKFVRFNESVLAGNKERLQFEIIALKGTRRWMDSTAVPFQLPDGKIVHLAITRDITHDKVREIELNRAKEKALQASQSKSEFLANMSHEIRTPMTAILGFMELLENDLGLKDRSSEAENAIQTIRNNANHLLVIINDILDMSKIESGQMCVETIATSPLQIIREVVNLVLPRALGKGINIVVGSKTPVPNRIESDPTRLRQILLNVIGNAIKFTEIGQIEILLDCDIEAEQLRFHISDSGVGMTPEVRDEIAKFAPFSQGDSSTTRRFGGSGLGLRISNSLAVLLGGGMSVQSEIDCGSTFTVSISTGSLDDVQFVSENEASHCDSETTDQEPVADECQSLHGIRILLAEDGPDNQRMISFLLRKAGAEVQLAENGKIALEKAIDAASRGCPFDVILMDMQMPIMDGYTAVKRLRSEQHQVVTIALTAHALNGDREKCLSAGCNDYATKPIDRKQLIQMIHRWTRSQEMVAP